MTKIQYTDNLMFNGLQKTDVSGKELLEIEAVLDNEKIMRLFSPKDLDVIYLIYVSGKSQNTVRSILKRSQPSICYDVAQIKRHINHVVWISKQLDRITEFVVNAPEWMTDEMKEVLIVMAHFGSYSAGGRILNVSYLKVRYRFLKLMKFLKQHGEDEMYDICKKIMDNLKVLKRA